MLNLTSGRSFWNREQLEMGGLAGQDYFLRDEALPVQSLVLLLENKTICISQGSTRREKAHSNLNLENLIWRIINYNRRWK